MVASPHFFWLRWRSLVAAWQNISHGRKGDRSLGGGRGLGVDVRTGENH